VEQTVTLPVCVCVCVCVRQRRARVREDGDLRDCQKGHMVRDLEQRVNEKDRRKQFPSKL
jgi:hypothetical protein